MGKPVIRRRKACLSLRELESSTGFSRSKLGRMPQAQLDALADAVANGTWKRSDARRCNPKNNVPKPDESPNCPGTLADFEGRFLVSHSLTAMVAYQLRDSRPDIAAKLTAILAKNQPWVDWLDAE